MTGAEIELLREIGKIPVQHFTITGADDWPMFRFMLGGLIALLTALAGLLLYIWRDLKKSIGMRRAEDASKCDRCNKSIWDHIENAVWKAIEGCCTTMPDVEKIRLRNEIRRNAEAGGVAGDA